MENHSDNSACIHAYIQNSIGKEACEIHLCSSDVDSLSADLVLNNKSMFCATASWLYRNKYLENWPQWAYNRVVGDRILKMILFSKGNIGYLNQVMCKYNLGTNGSWTQRVDESLKKRIHVQADLISLTIDFDKWTKYKYL